MRVFSIFKSISGELGEIYPGQWCIFLRLAKCNLSCQYCDTKYANTGTSGKEMTISEVIEEIKNLQPLDHPLDILITGGEPLLQMPEVTNLVERLRDTGLHISIETNGSIMPSKRLINEYPFMIFDYKLPSSGMEGEMINFNEVPWSCSGHAMIKFVCSDIHDYERAKEIILSIPRNKGYRYAISPALTPDHGFILNPDALYKWMLRDKLTNVMISTQLHKVLNLTEHP